jgi:hypothetical protein
MAQTQVAVRNSVRNVVLKPAEIADLINLVYDLGRAGTPAVSMYQVRLWTLRQQAEVVAHLEMKARNIFQKPIPRDVPVGRPGPGWPRDVKWLPPLRVSLTCTAAPEFEVIDAKQLGKYWAVPTSWVRLYSGPRCPPGVPKIPHIRLGRYVRFAWGSKELDQWLKDRFKK